MYFFLAAAAFAALLVSFHLVLSFSRRHPETFSGEWLVMITAVFYTGGLAGSFGTMFAAAAESAPTILVGLVVAAVTATVIFFGVIYIMSRARVAVPGAPIPG